MEEQDKLDELRQWLSQVQACIGPQLLLVETSAGRWTAAFEHGGSYQIEWSPAWGRLMLSGALGVPAPATERAALNLALSYNTLWREVGRLRMGRQSEDGTLVLIGEWDADRDDTEALSAALVNFEALRRGWSQVLMKCPIQPLPKPLPSHLMERV
jgi:hypothetical protein